MSLELTSQNVETTFKDCLFTDIPSQEEIEKRAVIVEGILHKFGFVPEKLEEHRADIISMLSCLPDDFMEGKGGGMSFLNACVTKNGTQWGEHHTMDLLFSLGQAIGAVKCVLPRNLWAVLPGGMPYYQVKLP
jgi:hypothetical protein